MKPDKTQLLNEALKNKNVISSIPLFWRMIGSFFKKGGYKPAKMKSVLFIAILVYLVSPLDFLPEWIPIIGVLDDIALLGFLIKMLLSETDKYIKWEMKAQSFNNPQNRIPYTK